MKKNIIIFIILFILMIIGVNYYSFYNKTLTIKNLNKDIHEILNYNNSGLLDINVNYKGSHGENNKVIFNYKYELSDKLYFEDDYYSYLDINFIDILNKIKSVDLNYYNSYKNNTFYYDDFNLKISKNNINIQIDNKNISIKVLDNSYLIIINDDININVIKDNKDYKISLSYNNLIFTILKNDKETNIVFNKQIDIYNSINIKVINKDIKLNKKKELKDFNDNPIIRYLGSGVYE